MRNSVFLLIFVLSGTVILAGCSDKTATDETTADQTTADETATDETAADETTADETATDETATDETATDEPATDEGQVDAADEAKDIVDTAVAADGFKTLVAAVQAAELVETLKGDGPFTVFAPTDTAFENLPEGTLDELLKPESKDKLTSILTYHVVPGKVMAADVVKLKSAKTVQGGEVSITVDGDKVKVDAANVTATDIECSNGVIHVIDAVILPE